MEATGDAAPPAPATFTGRTLSLEMGSVRLGGSSRPVTIASRTSDANDRGAAVKYRQPRILLEPQPRSPFGRKLEVSVNESFSTTKTQTHHTLRPSVTATPPERVHMTHHPTHRTPVDVALRHVDVPATPVDTLSRQHGAPRKRPTSSDSDKTTTSKRTSSRATKAKKNATAVFTGTSKPNHTARVQEPPPSFKLDHTHDLKPEQAKLFTRKPPSAQDEASQSHSFHVHERLSRTGEVETRAADETYEDTGDAPMSGWRAVDASIDYLYEDTSIDIVQLQGLVHGNAINAEKRKAVERERLQAAATELQKQRQGHNSKMIEFQHRREQIMKMSDDIRTRNKVSSQKTTKPLAPQKKKSDEALTLPTRKPPVPRLSQLGGKTKTPRPKKAESGPQTARNVKPSREEMESYAAADQETSGVSNTEDQVESQSYTHDSESIMLNNEDSTIANSTAGTASQSTAPTRVTKKRKAATTFATKTTQSNSIPRQQEEKSQRRAVAREYMQIQKQTRQLLRAKMEQQRQLDEERRRLDLQRLEKTRLLELEEARKRRIRQKQRDRAAQRKRGEQQRQLQQHGDDRSPSVHDTRDIMNAGEKDTENQSHRGNHASQQQLTRGASEWPSKYDRSPRSSSGAPSPRSLHRSQDEENGPLVVLSEPGPKLQKLLALEEQTKRLAEKLQSLSQQSPASDYIDIPHSAPTHHTGTQDGEMDSASAPESGDGDESDSSGSASTEMDKPDAEDEDKYSDGHSATRVHQEDFVGFDGGFPCMSDRDSEIDFSSIGVQHIHVVWPRGDLEEESEDAPRSTRFEMLSSSSSSSNFSDRMKQTDSQNKWGNSHSNTMSGSPKLLEESVDAYAERLLDRSVRRQSSTISDTPDHRTRVDSAKPIQSSSRYRSGVTAPKRTRPSPARSDAELLRLIRESDDNLSVIDREARRRFRLQQDRLRQRQQEQEQREQEELRRELSIARHARDVVHSSSTELVDSEPNSHQERMSPGMPATGSGDLRECEKLDEILQAVKAESAGLDRRDVEQIRDENHEEHLSSPTAAVEFWNTQLQQSGGHRIPRIEVDRTDLQAQHERALSLEEDGEDEDTRLRMLSPRTLAKRLLAAVEYHEAINEAHLQLSMIDKAQAINMVQQDAIALAQAFKEEMDDNLLTQHLVQEHAALEEEFDSNLKQVVDRLEAVREAEHRDNQIAKTQMEEEARVARQRESAVQTEPLHQVDAGTSARLHVEAATATDRERLDAAVQHDVGVVVSSIGIPRDAIATGTLVEEAISGDQESAVSDDYEQETFDQASVSSPLKISPQREQLVPGKMATVDVGEECMVENSEEIVSEEDQASRAHSDIEDDSDNNDEIASEDVARGEEEASENIKSDSIEEAANSLIEEDATEGDFESTERSSRQQSQSASIMYEDDDFEEDAPLVCPEETSQSDNATGVSEDRDIAGDTVLRPQSESTSGGYEEDGFEYDASASGGSKFHQTTHSGLVGETSDASVSSECGEDEEEDGDEAKSISDDASVEYGDNSSVAASRDKVAKLPSEGSPPPVQTIESVSSAPLSAMRVLSPTIDVSRLATTASLAPEITQSYLLQLENRKRSEEALLDLRLLALESKLQQEMQCIVDEIARAEEGEIIDKQVHSALELRKDTLQMGYLSEKANIESQKATCVSRYYQDLLAFRSLGAVATGSSIVASAVVNTARLLPVASSVSVLPAGTPVSHVTKPKDSESSDSNDYADDEFVASLARSEMAVGSNSDHDSMSEDDVHEAPSASHENDSEDVVEEADDEIRSEQSQEEKRDDSIASAPDDTAENDQNYEEEEFASMSETATMEKQDVVEEDEPSIVDEPDSAVDAEDEVASVADDEGLPGESDGAAIQETSTGSNPKDVDIVSDPTALADSAVVEGKDQGAESDETSQVYEDDEFASISEATVNAHHDSVAEDASVGITSTQTRKDNGESDGEDSPDDDAVDDDYEDEFASVSESAEAPDQLNSASEAEIQDDADIEIEDTKDDEYQSDDNYADDGFEASGAQVEETATAVTEPAGSSPSADQFGSGEEEEQQYSDGDFEQSEVRSNASRHETEESSNPNASAEESPPEVFNQTPTENAHVEAGEQAAYELPTIRSLSASELGDTNNPSTVDHDQTVAKPSALAESVSASLHEEDLTTASMEEQIQRIDDLKRHIDLRKETFAVVQKKLRVEKKKEHLREAETQLWAEMEQLESQLVADERILDLTRQRGRLESLALETKHWSLQLGPRGPTDLLADYDYCEPVESVKPVVTKQDHQAQVRVHDHHPAVATGAFDLDTTVHDLLLAFDHVEVAELPVTTVATNTDVEAQPRDVSPPPIVIQSDALRAAGHEEKEKDEKNAVRESAERSASQPEADVHQEEKATMPTEPVDSTADSAEIQAAHAPDLLSGYDYIETVLVADGAGDLLDGYDHVEEAEIPAVVGTISRSDDEELLQANTEVEADSAAAKLEVVSIPQEIADEEVEFLDESIDELEYDQGKQTTLLNRANTSDVVTDIGGVGGDEPALPDVVELNPNGQHVPAEEAIEDEFAAHPESEITDYGDIPDNTQFEEMTPMYSTNEDDRVALATENFLKTLLYEAVADIRNVSARTAARRTKRESLHENEPADFPPLKEKAHIEKTNIAEDANGDSVSDAEDDQKDEHKESCHPATSAEATPSDFTFDRGDEKPDERNDERQSDLLVDCLFANLLAAAIQESLRTEMKRRQIQLSDVHHDSQHQNAPPPASTTSSDATHVRASPPQSHRRIQEVIVNQLQVESGQVTLPAFHECVGSDLNAHNARAIYHAVLNVASVVHDHLNRDPLFLNEQSADKKHKLLVERVRRKMDDSIWCVQERARDELDRFARKLLEDEQGEVDQDDLRLLRAQQRTSSSIAMQAHYQAVALRAQTTTAFAVDDAITPRRRRLAVPTAQVSNSPGLAAQILAQEEERLAERITERMLCALVESETAAIAR